MGKTTFGSCTKMYEWRSGQKKGQLGRVFECSTQWLRIPLPELLSLRNASCFCCSIGGGSDGNEDRTRALSANTCKYKIAKVCKVCRRLCAKSLGIEGVSRCSYLSRMESRGLRASGKSSQQRLQVIR